MPEMRRNISRRTFLEASAVTAATAGLLGAGFAQAAAAPRRSGNIDEVEHVVILMQENRSLDHYYGTMKGVRGFGDRAAFTLSNGNDVLHQPDLSRLDGGYLLPFHIDTSAYDGQNLGDLPHDWDTTHLAVNGGAYNNWPLAKSGMTMGYFTENDVPFHHALAQAFTICDSYFCSIQGPTTPNRLYHWTGTIDPAGVAGGPATWNPSDYQPVYHWTTYPERLQAAGISWQVYASNEVGDDTTNHPYVGDYGDNPLWLFQTYHDALASTDPAVHQLADRASLRTQWLPDSGQGQNVDHVIAQFTADCAAGTLPSVSWVVAPYAYCEHPAARPVDGEVYVQAVLNALWSNPKLAENTVVFINYDENDGFYDHVLPPAPPSGTANEFLPASQPLENGFPPAFGPLVPIGLGPRVPMTVISPWSRGGWVNSQVFDHTSVLRFLETWTGVKEPNISDWRRAICGDLTSCFDFGKKNTSIPVLPDTAALQAQANATQSTLPAPGTPASGAQTVPVQDAGSVPARPLPYQANANVSVGSALTVTMTNAGTATVPLALYAHHLLSTDSTPFDLAPGATASTSVALDLITGAYNVYLYGPNGFLRHATGAPNKIEATLTITSGPALSLAVSNGTAQIQVVLISELDGTKRTLTLAPNSSQTVAFTPFASDNGWYDLSVEVDGYPSYLRRFAGHLENGNASVTG